MLINDSEHGRWVVTAKPAYEYGEIKSNKILT
jgi:hypothetical protein